MRINTKMRLAALLYLMAAYAVALPALALVHGPGDKRRDY